MRTETVPHIIHYCFVIPIYSGHSIIIFGEREEKEGQMVIDFDSDIYFHLSIISFPKAFT